MNSFNEEIDRHNTHSVKWDHTDDIFQKEALLPMWVADMDFKAPEKVIEVLMERVKHGVFGYSMPTQNTRNVVKDWLERRHDWSIDNDWIVFTSGVVPAIAAAINTYTSKDDKVLIQSPVYYPFRDMIEKNDRIVVDNPLVLESGTYKMDFEDLEQKVKDPAVKMLLLCNPHNPVGRVWTCDELTTLANLCVQHDVLIVSDDIHFDLILKGNEHTLISTLSSEIEANTITCISPSKTFNIAGLQASAIVIPDEKKREQYEDYMKKMGLFAPNALGILGIEAAYTHGEKWLDELLIYLEDNLSYLTAFIKENLPEIRVIQPEGTYLVWLDFRSLQLNHEELEAFIQNEAKLALDEGYIFGEGGKGFERINIACPRSTLEKGLKQLENAFRK
ncbi:MalY/PatB family protein [Alkalihalobacillus sp. CinArs1]|uniref:MalY/PatB family protein n=1 Tax=Alkalihalobacillus sp. CinArs1 TaxID=2995314 RepID=UPI0022DE8F94|nr:MalY/PatB family protein [Alkalihalobacillus sp. CinArs1]